jgi:hypothetical protein
MYSEDKDNNQTDPFEPKPTSDVESKKIIEQLGLRLDNIIAENKNKKISVQTFVPGYVLDITITDYLKRFNTYLNLPEGFMDASVFIHMGLIIDKYLTLCKEDFINPQNAHLLVATSLLLATKMVEDTVYTDKYFAKTASIEIDLITPAERALLNMLHHEVFFTPQEYDVYKHDLLSPHKEAAPVSVAPKATHFQPASTPSQEVLPKDKQVESKVDNDSNKNPAA